MHYLMENAIYKNHWLFIHVLFGGILAKALTMFGLHAQLVLIIVGIVAVLYEIYQWFFDHLGDKKRMIADSVADIWGAWLMALVVVV
jgi:hypothetical protein